MTYRERREARAEKLTEWAEKREAAASAQLESHPETRHDWAFITQPGHIPARARMIAADNRAFESLRKAESMASRAVGIAHQLETSIYDDDPDAVERLTERVATLEAQRETVKSENAAFRKAHRAELAGMTAYERDQAMPHRAYVLQNLGGNIKRNRDRLIVLERRVATAAKAEAVEGGVLVEVWGPGYVRVTFAEKPERDVIDGLKAAGFSWSKGSWYGAADKLPDGIGDGHGPGCDQEPAGLIGCEHPGCGARFFRVAAREFPGLCLDHAEDVIRAEHGWSPATSVD